MKIDKFARLALITGLTAGGAATGVGAPAQAEKGWTQSDKVCKVQTAGTVCLEQRTSTKTGERQSRMVLTPRSGQWIRPEVHATFGWDFGTETGACGQEGCAKVTEPMTGAWIRQSDEIRGLGYSTQQGDFDIYLGETEQQVTKSSGWKAEDPGRAAAQLVVKLKNNKTYYTGRLRLQSVDLMSLQPRTLEIELLNKGEVKASASTTYQGETEEVDWSSEVTKAIRMPSKGFEAIRVTGTYETPTGEKDSVTTTYTHGR